MAGGQLAHAPPPNQLTRGSSSTSVSLNTTDQGTRFREPVKRSPTTGVVMGRSRLAVVGAVAAVAGGAMWIVKGGVILAVGDQPPLMFEAAALLFPLALIGLHDRLGGEGGRRARTGGALARLAVATGLVAASYGLLVPEPSDVILSVLTAVTGLLTFIGLLLLGLAVRSVGALASRWRNLPAAMGIAAIPALTVIGGVLAAIHERLLELPIVALGVAWVVLGFLLSLPRGADVRSGTAAPTDGGSVPT